MSILQDASPNLNGTPAVTSRDRPDVDKPAARRPARYGPRRPVRRPDCDRKPITQGGQLAPGDHEKPEEQTKRPFEPMMMSRSDVSHDEFRDNSASGRSPTCPDVDRGWNQADRLMIEQYVTKARLRREALAKAASEANIAGFKAEQAAKAVQPRDEAQTTPAVVHNRPVRPRRNTGLFPTPAKPAATSHCQEKQVEGSRRPTYPPGGPTAPVDLQDGVTYTVWRTEFSEGRWTKIPYNPNRPTRRARSTDPNTWGTHAEAKAAYDASQSTDNPFCGIQIALPPSPGMVPVDGSGLVAIDVDDCVNPDGTLKPLAAEIVRRLGSYCEFSPSGGGLRIFCRGIKPRVGCKRTFKPDKEDKSTWVTVEMYDHAKLMTITGNHVPGTPELVLSDQAGIDWLHREYIAAPVDPHRQTPSVVASRVEDFEAPELSQDEIAYRMEKMLDSPKGAMLRSLLAGELLKSTDAPIPRGGDEMKSDGDKELFNNLVWWFSGDLNAIEEILLKSNRFNLRGEKWESPRNNMTWFQQELQESLKYKLANGGLYTGTQDVGPEVVPVSRRARRRSTPSPVHSTTTKPQSVPVAAKKEGGLEERLQTRVIGDYSIRAVDYLSEPRLPSGMIVIVAGAGGAGKSTLIMDAVARGTTGRAMLGSTLPPPPPFDVLLLASEDAVEDTVLPRFVAAGGDKSKLVVIEGVKDGKGDVVPFDVSYVSDIRAHIERSREEGRNYRLLVIDPLSTYVGRAGFDDHKDSELKVALAGLTSLAQDFGLTVLCSLHLNKNEKATTAAGRVMGGVAYGTSARLAYIYADDPEYPERRLLASHKSNLPGGKPKTLAVRISPTGLVKGLELLGSTVDHMSEEHKTRLANQLYTVDYEGEVATTADDLVCANKKKGPPSGSDKIRTAAAWLKERLKAGPARSNDTAREGDAMLGIPWTAGNPDGSLTSTQTCRVRWWRETILQGELGGSTTKDSRDPCSPWLWSAASTVAAEK